MGIAASERKRGARHTMASSQQGMEDEEYGAALGVIIALERTCELEARLRQAIQDTHPLTTTLDWDFHAADQERGALLALRCGGGQGPRGGACSACTRRLGSSRPRAAPRARRASRGS